MKKRSLVAPALRDSFDLTKKPDPRPAVRSHADCYFPSMDWSAVALFVMERAELPIVLLDGAGRVLLVSPAAEQKLGWRTENAERDWIATCVAPGSAASARWSFDRARHGALRKLEIEVHTARGPQVAYFEANPLGEGVLLVLTQLTPVAREDPTEDYDYEVTGLAAGGFRLTKLRSLGVETTHNAGRCYESLHGRSSPCDACPLLGAPNELRAGVVVRSQPGRGYLLTTAAPLGSDSARVSVRRLSVDSLAALLQARLDELASKAGLSPRERSVLGHLMDGRAVEQIASELEISPRTVKFHQANLLQKLGADSRSDLMRLVF